MNMDDGYMNDGYPNDGIVSDPDGGARTDDEAVVSVDHLSKKRGKKQVLTELSFEIQRGRVFGLIGPNGAGKTTTIKILLGMLAADSGSTRIFDEPSMEMSIGCRQRIGYLSERSEHPGLPIAGLPIAGLLEYYSHFFPRWDWCRHLVKTMQVVEDRNIYAMSEGERRKAELLVTLAHKPDLLILDDPAAGLDARARRDILWATLEATKQEGKTIIFTSHVLQDVERVVDDVLILDHGKVRVAGPLDELKARTRRIVLPGGGDGLELETLPGELRRQRHGRDLVVITDRFSAELEERLGRRAPGVIVEHLNLEEIFCEVIEESGEDEAAGENGAR